MSYISNTYDRVFAALRLDDGRLRDELNILSASSFTRGSTVALIAEISDRWNWDNSLFLVASSNVASAIHNVRQCIALLDYVESTYLTPIFKSSATILGDAALSFSSVSLGGLISSGSASLSPNTVSSASTLSAIHQKIVKLFPNAEEKLDDQDAVHKYLLKANHVYDEFAAAAHPDRDLDGIMFASELESAMSAASISSVLFGFGVLETFAIPAAYGGLAVVRTPGTGIITAQNNNAGVTTANDTGFGCVINPEKKNTVLLIYGDGSAGNAASLELPVATNKGSITLGTTLVIEQREISEIGGVTDAGGAALVVGTGSMASYIIRCRSSTGAVVSSSTVVCGPGDRISYNHIDNMPPNSYFTFQPSTFVGRVVPTAGTYQIHSFIVNWSNGRAVVPASLGRISDVVANPNVELLAHPELFTHGFLEGMSELHKINEWLISSNGNGFVSAINGRYQGIRVTADTKATLSNEVLDMGWWIGLSDGVSKNTKRRLYQFWYSLAVDYLRMASSSREFARYVMTG